MTDNTLWPFWLLALVLHGALALALFGNTPQTPIALTGDAGTGIKVGLDQTAYQTLLQQQTKVNAQKAAKARTIKQAKMPPKPIKVKQQQANKPTTVAHKTIVKPVVKPVAKLVTKAVAAPPVAAATETKAQALQKVAMLSPAQTQLTATPDTQTDTANSDTAQPSATATDTTASDTQHAQSAQNTAAATSNTTTEKAMGTPAPLVMDDATKRYIRALMRHISQFKAYPAALKKAHIEGTPIIRFTFNKDGEVLETTIKKRSSHQALDQAAIEVFKKANPLPPIPPALRRDTLTMSLPIKFNLIND